jgi:hypothetical protein
MKNRELLHLSLQRCELADMVKAAVVGRNPNQVDQWAAAPENGIIRRGRGKPSYTPEYQAWKEKTKNAPPRYVPSGGGGRGRGRQVVNPAYMDYWRPAPATQTVTPPQRPAPVTPGVGSALTPSKPQLAPTTPAPTTPAPTTPAPTTPAPQPQGQFYGGAHTQQQATNDALTRLGQNATTPQQAITSQVHQLNTGNDPRYRNSSVSFTPTPTGAGKSQVMQLPYNKDPNNPDAVEIRYMDEQGKPQSVIRPNIAAAEQFIAS